MSLYTPYLSISKKGDESTFVQKEILQKQQKGISKINQSIVKNWDQWVADQLQMTVQDLFRAYSSEQIDSIGLNILNFQKGNGFIIADETGIGKGRILSGITRWAIVNNKKVLFITEREDLFSDFFRDLKDTHTIDVVSDPLVLHNTSTVYDMDSGEVIIKGNARKNKLYFKDGFNQETNLILTNYSQINSAQHLKEKLPQLLKYTKDNVIILDESHNASGDSNTNKFLTKLLDATRLVTFSSATYIKDESQLALYEKAISFDQETIELMKKILPKSKDQLLRKKFTEELTQKLHLWRREHEPIEDGWNTITVHINETNKHLIDQYSNIINQCFYIIKDLSENPALEKYDVQNHWFLMGNTINRISRNLILILKSENIAQTVIEQSINNNNKAVIILDSTFNSIIKNSIDYQTHILKKEIHELTFTYVLQYIIYEVVGKFIEENREIISKETLYNYEQLINSTHEFSHLSISLIDKILNDFNQKGIQAGEISGRKERVVNGELVKFNQPPKVHTTAQFNAGELDVLLITRAGASGISIQSGKHFKDQRQRDLYELEITTRPTYRVQFRGRVNRRNQVIKPRYFAIVTDTAFEQRILNTEKNKLDTLQAHVSAATDTSQEDTVYPFYTDFCDRNAYLYLKRNPQLAYQMGISLKGTKEELYYIDSILKRSMVLESERQRNILDYLIHSTKVESLLSQNEITPTSVAPNQIISFWHDMNPAEQESLQKIMNFKPSLLINNFNYKWVGMMKTINSYSVKNLFFEQNKIKIRANKKNTQDTIQYIMSVFKRRKEVNQDYVNNHLIPQASLINIGSEISMQTEQGDIIGIVYDLIEPDNPLFKSFANLYVLHLKTINPSISNQITYNKEDYFITLEDLFLNSFFNVRNKAVWNNYERAKTTINRITYYWIGNPIYVEFIKSAYNTGQTKQITINNENHMVVELPRNINPKHIYQSGRPIYKPKEVVEALKKQKEISTKWESHDNIKAIFILTKMDNKYLLKIASEIADDRNIIDYPLKKALSQRAGEQNGYQRFFIDYKQIYRVLYMLEKRGVIWFR